MREMLSSVQSRQIASPKTVLGFYAGVMAILDSASLVAIGVLAQTHTMTWLIPWILGFAAAVFVLLLGGVFALNLFDPSKLMLGQVSGTEYAALHSVRLGDSATGERDAIILERETRLLPGRAESLAEPASAKVESGTN